jgi:hypothetical protein
MTPPSEELYQEVKAFLDSLTPEHMAEKPLELLMEAEVLLVKANVYVGLYAIHRAKTDGQNSTPR